jgi:hypothetical protein
VFLYCLYLHRIEHPFNKGESHSLVGASLSWSWSYGSWIYNNMCNQCLTPLKLRVRTPFVDKCTRFNIM